MDKSNVFRSSNFYMAENDILHIRFKDEQWVTPSIMLNVEYPDGTNSEQEAPGAAIALSATEVTSSSFTANWNFTENSTGYYLDVATDSAFSSMVAGYNGLDVGNVKERDVVGLGDAITYFYRLKAYNDYGTGANSNIVTTLTSIESVVDGDGNVYSYITIGSQQWLVENLKTTKYIDGAAIPNLTINGNWVADITGAYCWYNNDIANKADYGALYNWYAVNNAHGLAPTGWRVPSQADFDALITFIGEYLVAGGKLKEEGLVHWNTPNTGATDNYGFKGVGAGNRQFSIGTFENLKDYVSFWLTTIETADASLTYTLVYNTVEVVGTNVTDNNTGVSVRCMRDI